MRGQCDDEAHGEHAVQQVGDPGAGGGRPVGPHTRCRLQAMARESADGRQRLRSHYVSKAREGNDAYDACHAAKRHECKGGGHSC